MVIKMGSEFTDVHLKFIGQKYQYQLYRPCIYWVPGIGLISTLAVPAQHYYGHWVAASAFGAAET